MPTKEQIGLLPEDALTVAYAKKQETTLQPKTVLEKRADQELTSHEKWLAGHSIKLHAIAQNVDHLNQALDTLLSSGGLQSEFLHRTGIVLQTAALAQPHTVDTTTQTLLAHLKQLEHQVRALSPAFLSDYIVSSSDDEAFLLRDKLVAASYGFDTLRHYIQSQRAAGREHLAAALAKQAGFTF